MSNVIGQTYIKILLIQNEIARSLLSYKMDLVAKNDGKPTAREGAICRIVRGPNNPNIVEAVLISKWLLIINMIEANLFVYLQ